MGLTLEQVCAGGMLSAASKKMGHVDIANPAIGVTAVEQIDEHSHHKLDVQISALRRSTIISLILLYPDQEEVQKPVVCLPGLDVRYGPVVPQMMEALYMTLAPLQVKRLLV